MAKETTEQIARRYELRRIRRDNAAMTSGKPLIRCLECGREMRSLAGHLRTHDITKREYYLKHKVPIGSRLVPNDLRETFKTRCRESGRADDFVSYTRSDQHIQTLRDTASDRGIKISETYQNRMTGEKRAELAHRMFEARLKGTPIAARRAINEEAGLRVERTCHQCAKIYSCKKSAKQFFCCAQCYYAYKRSPHPAIGALPLTDPSKRVII